MIDEVSQKEWSPFEPNFQLTDKCGAITVPAKRDIVNPIFNLNKTG